MNTDSIVSQRLFLLFLTCILVMAHFSTASAHGFAGKRFFPSTINVDDPFMNDELSFVYTHDSASGTDPSKVSTLVVDYAKTITKHFGLSVGGTLIDQNPQAGNTQVGFDNIDLGVKDQFFTSGEHETILAVGSDFSLAHTGQAKVGAKSYTTFSPTLYFGKGFGDLPDSMGALKPLAITGTFAGNIPSRASTVTANGIALNPVSLSWGFTLQYSLPYLTYFVKDIGLPSPIDHMIPIVEFAFNSGLNQGSGPTTGTANPGILWMGSTMEVGIEAQIPINNHSGNHVGVSMIIHFFLDDLFPHSLGKPLGDFS